MDAPAFSVIVPAFDSRGRIGSTLRSVLAQSRRDLELIVVDDGSADGTADEAEAFAETDPRVIVLRQENAGTAAARNAGLDVARGRYVSFLDDDDLWLPGFLERAGAALERTPGAGLAYCDAWVVDATTGLVGGRTALERFAPAIRRLPRALSAERTLTALLRINFLTTCAVTVRRDAVEAAGCFDTAIRGSDDWDLWLRIAGAGHGSVRIGEALAVLVKRAGSAGSDELMMARNAALVLRSARERTADPGARAIAARHLRLVEAEIAAIESGSRLGRIVRGAARRRGRKRTSLRPEGGSFTPEGELAGLLNRYGAR